MQVNGNVAERIFEVLREPLKLGPSDELQLREHLAAGRVFRWRLPRSGGEVSGVLQPRDGTWTVVVDPDHFRLGGEVNWAIEQVRLSRLIADIFRELHAAGESVT